MIKKVKSKKVGVSISLEEEVMVKVKAFSIKQTTIKQKLITPSYIINKILKQFFKEQE